MLRFGLRHSSFAAYKATLNGLEGSMFTRLRHFYSCPLPSALCSSVSRRSLVRRRMLFALCQSRCESPQDAHTQRFARDTACFS